MNQTEEAAPSTSPRDLTVRSVDERPTSVILHWQPPKTSNGPITGQFNIQFKDFNIYILCSLIQITIKFLRLNLNLHWSYVIHIFMIVYFIFLRLHNFLLRRQYESGRRLACRGCSWR